MKCCGYQLVDQPSADCTRGLDSLGLLRISAFVANSGSTSSCGVSVGRASSHQYWQVILGRASSHEYWWAMDSEQVAVSIAG